MSFIGVVAPVISVLAVTGVAWLYSQQRRRHRLGDSELDWIRQTMTHVKQATATLRRSPHAGTAADLADSFDELRAIIAEQSDEAIAAAAKLEAAWSQLQRLVASAETDAVATSNARISTLANQIDNLVEELQSELQ